jgi:Spy/CpxP family protein refolding chaperone
LIDIFRGHVESGLWNLEAGEPEMWTNDRHLLAAATHFGITARSWRLRWTGSKGFGLRVTINWKGAMRISKSFFAGFLASGLLLAQSAGVNMTVQERQEMRLNMMSSFLGLTDSQKSQLQSIWNDVRGSAQPLQRQIQQGRQALLAAVKDGKEQREIDRLTREHGNLLAELTAKETAAFAKLFAVLNPEQQKKAEDLYARMPGMLFEPAMDRGNPEMQRMGHGEGKLKPGDPAPDFDLLRLHSQQQVRLSSFKNKKPVALVFGSYT